MISLYMDPLLMFVWIVWKRFLNRCIETNLVLKFEKCHFMVEQGIVLGHIISNKGI